MLHSANETQSCFTAPDLPIRIFPAACVEVLAVGGALLSVVDDGGGRSVDVNIALIDR